MLLNKLLPIFEKIMLGVTLAAPIGPVSIEMIKRGLKNGFWSAFNVRLGGAVGNTLCLIGTYLGLSQVMGHPQVMNTLGFLGALLLLYMGINTFRNSAVTVNLMASIAEKRNGLLLGFYLSIFNPVSLVFWPGIFAASMGAADALSVSGLLLNFFVIAGVLIWGAGLSLVLAFGSHVLNKTAINNLTKLAAVLMIFYGLKYAYSVWVRF